MQHMRFLIALLTVALPVAAASPGSSQTSPSEQVVIDGSKNPEMIPLWLIWQNTFQVVVHIASRKIEGFGAPYEQIGVSPKEWEIILSEARHQGERAAKRLKEYPPLVDKMRQQKKSMSEMFDALEPFELEDRWEFLAGRERVSAQLSPEGLSALLQWIERRVVRGLTMTMRKSQFERFRRPM